MFRSYRAHMTLRYASGTCAQASPRARSQTTRNPSAPSPCTPRSQSLCSRDYGLSQHRATFASGGADNIKQWYLPDGKFIQNLAGHNTIINTMAINSDGVLVSGGEPTEPMTFITNDCRRQRDHVFLGLPHRLSVPADRITPTARYLIS